MKASIASFAVVAASLAASSSLAAPSLGQQSQITFNNAGIAELKSALGELSSIKLDPGNVVQKGASWLKEHINDPRCESSWLERGGDAQGEKGVAIPSIRRWIEDILY